jgi:hypothetical protein
VGDIIWALNLMLLRLMFLISGNKYNLWFPNYTVQSGSPVPSNNKATTERFSISIQTLDYVIGTFRLPGHKTIGKP